MQKLLLILVCLFVSFEVKSVSDYEVEDVKIKDCLKYLDKGKILHKFENINTWGKDEGGEINEEVVTIFSYNQKTYKHTLHFSVFKFSDEVGTIRTEKTFLKSSDCIMIDFDNEKDKDK